MNQNKLSLIIAGDYHIYGHYGNVKGKFDDFVRENPEHKIFSDELADYIKKADFRIFNLEDPISKKKQGILKNGPHGVGSAESLKPIKDANFNLATFATNHTYDMGNEGIKETMKACKEYSIDLIGCGLTQEEARRIYYKKIKNTTLALLNFSRIEFNCVTQNHGGANPLDTINNSYDIIEAKKNSDLVFVIVHEGLDVFHLPYPKLVQQMRYYADMGADAIILHHSRVVSGYEIYNKTPIFYGLGNLLHLARNTEEHEGIILKFEIDKKKINHFDIVPIQLDLKNVVVSVCKEGKRKYLINKIDKYSEIIKNENKLSLEWKLYAENKAIEYLSIINYVPRILFRLCRKLKLIRACRKILFFNKNRYLPIVNLLNCSSHNETLKKILSLFVLEE